MKFINYLASIADIGIFPLTSLLIFVVFFAGLGIYVLKADKDRLRYLSALPVDKEDENEKKTSSKE